MAVDFEIDDRELVRCEDDREEEEEEGEGEDEGGGRRRSCHPREGLECKFMRAEALNRKARAWAR